MTTITRPRITAAQFARIEELAQSILNDHESDIQALCLDIAESHGEIWTQLQESDNDDNELEFLEALESAVMTRIAHKFRFGYYS